VLDGAWPSLFTVGVLLLLTTTALALGTYVFRRLQPGFADVL
jgi:ABC-type polysaccharide/polyol phosphate export permease